MIFFSAQRKHRGDTLPPGDAIEEGSKMKNPRLIPAAIAAATLVLFSPSYATDPVEPAGMIKTSRGTVTVERAGQRTPAPPGTTVEVGDRVRTGNDGYVGITLRDDTLITAGPASTLLINDFKFNTTTNTGSMLASFLKGTFGVVTGLLAKQSPESVQFKTPTTSLGIRGTEFLVEVLGAKDE
jgi:hypothetical protein